MDSKEKLNKEKENDEKKETYYQLLCSRTWELESVLFRLNVVSITPIIMSSKAIIKRYKNILRCDEDTSESCIFANDIKQDD